jgi:hypothetical protein
LVHHSALAGHVPRTVRWTLDGVGRNILNLCDANATLIPRGIHALFPGIEGHKYPIMVHGTSTRKERIYTPDRHIPAHRESARRSQTHPKTGKRAGSAHTRHPHNFGLNHIKFLETLIQPPKQDRFRPSTLP